MTVYYHTVSGWLVLLFLLCTLIGYNPEVMQFAGRQAGYFMQGYESVAHPVARQDGIYNQR